MARMPILAATTTGERRRLFQLWATTAPSAGNWQEPLGQDSIPQLSSWPSDTQKQFLFAAPVVALIVICVVVCLFRRCNKTNEQDTSMFVPGTWSNANSEDVIAPLPWQQQEQSPPASGDGHAPSSNSGRGDGPPPPRRRRRQQPPNVAEVPVADLDLALGDVQLTEAGVEWVLANLELLAPTTDMEIAPMEDVEIAPAPEPAPTVKCTFSKAEGWAEGICSVCLSELVDGVKVRVLTACMHCFHATCVERCLRENATCPLCRAPTMVVPARGRRRQRRCPVDSNLSLA